MLLSFLLCSSQKQDLNLIQKASLDIAAQKDERWNVFSFKAMNEAEAFWRSSSVDCACIEIISDKHTLSAEKFRKNHKETLIAVIADTETVPILYLKPSIMAASLLLRPFSIDEAKRVVKELVEVSNQNEVDDDYFEFKLREEVQRIRYRDILFFEARDKKIYLRTAFEEFSFYTTIEKLGNSLPDCFQKCHRSFIININKIIKISLAENIVCLEDEIAVPLSRGFRDAAKKGWKNNNV